MIRYSHHDEFFGCSNYPDCTITRNLIEIESAELEDKILALKFIKIEYLSHLNNNEENIFYSKRLQQLEKQALGKRPQKTATLKRFIDCYRNIRQPEKASFSICFAEA